MLSPEEHATGGEGEGLSKNVRKAQNQRKERIPPTLPTSENAAIDRDKGTGNDSTRWLQLRVVSSVWLLLLMMQHAALAVDTAPHVVALASRAKKGQRMRSESTNNIGSSLVRAHVTGIRMGAG